MREFLKSGVIFDRMEKLRKEQDLTLYALAKKANVSVNALYHWRDYKSSPTLYLLECLADALNVALECLIFDTYKTEDLTSEQRLLLERWNRLTTKQKSTVLNILDTFEN